MKNKIIFLTALIGIAGILLFLTSCSEQKAPQITYTVSSCMHEPEGLNASVTIYSKEGKVFVEQIASYVCCANITLETKIDDSTEIPTIKIFEKNKGEICKCICNYNITAEIYNLTENIYNVEIYGIEYPNVHPFELLGSQQLTVVNGINCPQLMPVNPKLIEKCKNSGGTVSGTISLNGCMGPPQCNCPANTVSKEWACYPESLYCESDKDCVCGGKDILTGNCFVDNIDYYNKYVDKSNDCPDFCTGIAANMETKCRNNKCQIVNKNIAKYECAVDEDCIAEQCCHATSCVNKNYAADCSGKFCTMQCAENTLDCGQGHCGCIEGTCSAVMN